MFTQPCFIRKNTPELRKKLEDLGYIGVQDKIDTNIHKSIFVYQSPIEKLSIPEYIIGDNSTLYFGILASKFIDCGENETLFLAMASWNSENPYDVWFAPYLDKKILRDGKAGMPIPYRGGMKALK